MSNMSFSAKKKRELLCLVLLGIFLIQLIWLLWGWQTHYKGIRTIRKYDMCGVGEAILKFFSFLTALSGFCLLGLFSRLGVEQFSWVDWILGLLFFSPALIIIFCFILRSRSRWVINKKQVFVIKVLILVFQLAF